MNSSLDTTSRHIYSVSELNRTARQILDIELPPLWLEGEISNFSKPASGHWYFSLKDENAQIRCAMFRRANARIRFQPENGDKVLVRGKISLYEARGDYQLIADLMEDAGTGALQRAFEQLRDKLSQEGLFAAAHKKDLPRFPSKIGIITSSTGAALHDILQVLERRLPLVDIKVYPVLVQGELAPAAISQAIAQADKEKTCDVLIVGRGGGSLEDLWAFNDERVARAAFDCSIPIISAVGHEVDFTILDFIADLRAATPSVAAELATPFTVDDLRASLSGLNQHITRITQERLHKQAQQLNHLNKRLQLAHPGLWVQQQQQRLDNFSQRIQNLLSRSMSEQTRALEQLTARFKRQSPEHALAQKNKDITFLHTRLQESLQHRLQSKQQSLRAHAGKLNALSPLATLDRGYALVQRGDATLKKIVLSSVQDIKKNDIVLTRLKDGQFESQITKVIPE